MLKELEAVRGNVNPSEGKAGGYYVFVSMYMLENSIPAELKNATRNP